MAERGKDNVAAAAAFLRALWPQGLPDEGRVVICTKTERGMAPAFFSDLAEAATHAAAEGRARDVYAGVSAQPELPRGRGTTETALAVPGLWLDIDFDKGARSMAGAEKFLAALPFPPTMLVATGGGVHAYWLFKEFLEERAAAVGLELGWLKYCREVARLESGGAELDAVADLARVMRVPGTGNFKRPPAVTPVKIVLLEGTRRYNPSDFDQWRVEAGPRTMARVAGSFEFTLREDRQPPFDKWHVAVINQPEIERAFNHRSKMPVDNSLSGYDLGLATRLDALGWTAQEIVDTLIAHRRKWASEVTDARTAKDPLHLQDPGYYERLLRKAKATNDRDRVTATAARLAEEVTEDLDTLDRGQPAPPGARVKWFRAVSEQMRIEVVDLWAVDSVEGHWNVRIMVGGEMRDVVLPSPRQILQWDYWVELVLKSRTAVDLLPAKPPPQFRPLMARAGSVLRVLGAGPLGQSALVEYLYDLCQEAPAYEEADIMDRRPFRKVDGGPRGIEAWGEPKECLFLRPDECQYDVKIGRCPKPPGGLGHALMELGFLGRVVAVRAEELRRRGSHPPTTRKYYCFPTAELARLARRGSGGAGGQAEEGEGAAAAAASEAAWGPGGERRGEEGAN